MEIIYMPLAMLLYALWLLTLIVGVKLLSGDFDRNKK